MIVGWGVSGGRREYGGINDNVKYNKNELLKYKMKNKRSEKRKR